MKKNNNFRLISNINKNKIITYQNDNNKLRIISNKQLIIQEKKIHSDVIVNNNYNNGGIIKLLKIEINLIEKKIKSLEDNLCSNTSLNTELNEKVDIITDLLSTIDSIGKISNIEIDIESLKITIPSKSYSMNGIIHIDNSMHFANTKLLQTGIIKLNKNIDFTKFMVCGTLCIYCTDNNIIYNGIVMTNPNINYLMSNRPILPIGIPLNGYINISLKIISI